MKKILNIAWKDLLVTFSDPAALLLTLATPFGLTLVMLFAFGGVQNNGIRGIPVAVVNQDDGQLGEAFDEVLSSETVSELLAITSFDQASAARAGVDRDEYAAAVIVPADMTSSLMPAGFSGKGADLDQPIQPEDFAGWDDPRQPIVIEIYANPTRPTGISVVRTVVDEFINRTATMFTGAQVSVVQMLKGGLISAEAPRSEFFTVAEASVGEVENQRLITLASSLAEGSLDNEFDWLAYMAPSMAILFLMFTMTNGGRSILGERESGTLPRMLTTPSSPTQVIGGKVFGIYLNGLAQMLVLMVASLVLFQMQWGPFQVVVPTILLVVAAATGWGMLIAAFSRTPGQANAMGT
ncbi:MAG: ABC transporter permease, partial [Anaerolineales bacterium]|nr:ABC transporter permease [Anaerolineales bacterium]